MRWDEGGTGVHIHSPLFSCVEGMPGAAVRVRAARKSMRQVERRGRQVEDGDVITRTNRENSRYEERNNKN